MTDAMVVTRFGFTAAFAQGDMGERLLGRRSGARGGSLSREGSGPTSGSVRFGSEISGSLMGNRPVM